MKKIIPLMLLLAALFLVPSYSYPSSLGAVHLSLIDGDVQIYTEDTSEWIAADINMPLKDGDRIWVPEGGRTELQLSDSSSLRLSEGFFSRDTEDGGTFFAVFSQYRTCLCEFQGIKGHFPSI